MMNRKTLTSRLVFNEAMDVAPPGNGVLSQHTSAQKRLFPKAEPKKVAFNPPIPSVMSSPAVHRMRPLVHYNIKSPQNIEKRQPTISWKPAAMFKPSSPLTPPFSPDVEVLNADSCICERPPKLILCSACSHTTKGRLRKTCQVHPKALYLLDIDACPSCKKTQFVLKEYELPNGNDVSHKTQFVLKEYELPNGNDVSHVKDRNEDNIEVVTKKGKRARSDDDMDSQKKRTRRDGPRSSR